MTAKRLEAVGRGRTWPGRPTLRSLGCGAVLGYALLAELSFVHAQEVAAQSGSQRTLALVPRLTLGATLTNNLSPGQGLQDKGLMGQLSPGLNLVSNSGRVKGYLDYSLNGLAYLKSVKPDQVQNTLNAAFNVEAFDQWAFLDVRSSIAQQAVSAFGVQAADIGQANANRAEVWTLSVAPYVRGNFGGNARYELRAELGGANTRKAIIGDQTNANLQMNMSGGGAGSALSWNLFAAAQMQDYKVGRRTTTGRLGGGLSYALLDDLRVSVNGGQESNNLITLEQQREATYGVGLTWTPTERTRLAVQRDHRFFGEGHSFNFEHRFARSVWRFNDVKNVSSPSGQGGLGTNYDLFYTLFASLVPDPAQRQAYVLDFLQSRGLNPTAVVVGGFLSSAATLTRLQDFSVALSGVRDTVTFTMTRNQSRRLDPTAQVQDDLNNSALVLQSGFNLNLSHRLTPQSAANLSLAKQKTTGSLASQSSTLRSILGSWSATLGARTTVVLGGRYTLYRATQNSYNEKALYANLTRRF